MLGRISASGSAAFALSLALCAAAGAAPASFEFSARVESVDSAAAAAGIAVGMLVRGSYTFDDAAPATLYPNVAAYIAAIATFSLDVPAAGYSRSESVPADGASSIQVHDYASPDAGASDVYYVEAHGSAGGDLTLELRDDTRSALHSLALPLAPPGLAAFGSARLSAGGITAIVTSLTLGDVATVRCRADLADSRDELTDSRAQEPPLYLEVRRLQQTLAGCEAFRTYIDSDGDSEEDTRDACPATTAGAGVDRSGCSIEQFCGAISVASGGRVCKRADFANDEPLAKSPRDCRVLGAGQRACARY